MYIIYLLSYIPYISAMFATWKPQSLCLERGDSWRPDSGEAQPCTRRALGLAPAGLWKLTTDICRLTNIIKIHKQKTQQTETVKCTVYCCFY